MARPTISQRIALEGGEQIKRALTDLGQAGEDAFAKLQKAGERLNLTAPVGALAASAKTASATIEELRQRMAGIGGAASQSGSGFAAFGGVVQSTQQRLVAAVNVGARVGLAVQEIGTAFAGSFGKVREFGAGVGSVMGDVSTTVLKSVAALGAVPAAFLAIATSAANAAAKVKEASIAAGTSPQEYQKLTIAAEQMGGSEEKLVLALSVINEKVQEQSQNFYANQKRLQDLREATIKGGLAGRQAAEDYKSLKQEMELFGPSVSRSGQSIIDVDKALKNLRPSNKDAIERLKGLADEIKELPTPAEKSARVIEVFGRRLGPQLVELLSEGRVAIDDIGKRAENLGLVMSDTQFKVAKDVTDSIALLQRAVAATKNSIGLLFGPAIVEAADMLTEAIGRNRTSLILWAGDMAVRVRPILLDLVRALTGETDGIETGWIKTARQLIVDLGAAIVKVVQNIIVPAFQALGAILQSVATAINGIFGTKLTAADVGVVLLLAKMVGAFTLLAGVLRLVGGGLGLLRTAFVAVASVGSVLGAAMQALGGVFGVIRLAVAGLVAAFGAVPIAIAAIGVVIGFLAALIVRAIDWSAFAERARAAFNAVLAFIAGFGASVSAQFQVLVQAGQTLWNTLATAAQVAFAAIAAGASSLWSALQALWSSGVAAMAGIWNSVASAATSAMEQISAGAAALWTLIVPVWQAGIDSVGLLWERLKAGAQAAWQSLVAGVAATWDAIASAWNAGVERVIGYLTKLRDFAVGVWNAIVDAAKRAFGAQQQAAGAANAGGRGLAGGGPVFGRGTATSDSIPAWLSNGEFVVRAAAVRKYGVSLLHSLNCMRLNPDAFARFAEGGLVRPMQMLLPQPLRFAEGGLVPAGNNSSLRPINLTLGAETFAGLLAPENVAQKLMQVAVSKQIRSAGRRPGYYGSR